MQTVHDTRPGTWRQRTVVAIGVVAATVVAAAVPALAHASFPSSAAFGFAPNTAGGTGAVGAAPPYAAGSTPTVYLRAPFEQTEPFNGSDDTTVDLKVVVPAGWTSPTCGAARKQINSAATNNTNQPGDVVAGWTCEVVTENGRQVLHWHGPQVAAPATFVDSAQFFVFSVTAPSPLVQTTYNGTGGTEGFIADQQYASGETVHWIPNAAFPGNPPPGSASSVAGGLARTVAAAVFGGYHPLAPARVLDTRFGTGLSGRFDPGQTRELSVTGAGGVPADASAVVLNVTVEGGTAASHLTVWPTGQTQPTASNLNWAAGETRPNAVKVKVGTGGKVSIRNNSGTVHVIADVFGHYAASGDLFTGAQPDRILDTRDGTGLTGAFTGGQSRDLPVSGAGGVPGDATAVVLNVTVTRGTAASHLTISPFGETPPLTSNLNWVPNQTVPNLVIAKLGTDGKITIRNNAGTVHVLADVLGWYRPTGDRYAAVQPTRLLDTRDGTGLSGRFGNGQSRDLAVADAGGVPAGATAAVLNVTVTGGTGASHLTAWPKDGTVPDTSNLNWVAGETVANLVVVKVGTDGKVTLRNNEHEAHVVADVVGYFAP